MNEREEKRRTGGRGETEGREEALILTAAICSGNPVLGFKVSFPRMTDFLKRKNEKLLELLGRFSFAEYNIYILFFFSF